MSEPCPTCGHKPPKRVRRRIGATERAYRVWLRDLGQLSPRQAAMVAQILALARQLDTAHETDKPLSAVAAVSRELRQAADGIRDVKVGAGSAQPEKPKDVVDQVQQARQRRQQKAREAAAT